MKKRIVSLLTAAALIMPAFTAMAKADSVTVVRLDPSEASPFNGGEFQGWGTSLCWWANRLGYSERLTQQAADAFFSEDGLGLDIARYNLGGGDDPSHNHITRSDSKVPSYAVGFDDNGDIIYDWSADENQRNIALAALKANPGLYFEGFSNSPPWFMTISGCSSGAENAGEDNLAPEHYDDFGKFIAEVTKHLDDEYGIKFQSYSPMNEPDTTYWGAYSPKQEGAHYSPGETQSGTIIATRKALDAKSLTDVLVAGTDETDIDKAVKNYSLLSDEAKAALGRIDTHTYGGSQRRQLKETAVNAGKDLWMSEVDGGWDGFGLANRIILDMNGMQSAAWVMWDIVDFHKDSNFTTPDGAKSEAEATLNVQNGLWGVAMADHDTETLELSNKYYFYGQFTRYINPGDTIIASSNNTLAAYNRDSGDIKIVAINQGTADREYQFDLSAFVGYSDEVTEIRTNNEIGENAEHWKEITGEAEFMSNGVHANRILKTILKAGTVTTYIIHGKTNPDLDFDPLTGKYSYSENVAARSLGERVALYDANGVLKAVKTDNIGKFDEFGEGYMAKLFADNDISYMMIKGDTTVMAGETADYTLSIGPKNVDTPVIWEVSDDSIATVDRTGKLTAIKRGDIIVGSYSPILDISTSINVHITDDSEKYDGAAYTFVSNVKEATNDFEKSLDGFKVSGDAALTKDGADNNVLGIQPEYNNKDGAAQSGSAELDLKNLTVKDNQTVNIAFDIYVSNSGGTADFVLYGDNGTELLKMYYHDWDTYDMTAGGNFTTEAEGAKVYLRNYVNDKMVNQLISNGAHVEIYYTPSTGEIKVTLKNNTNDEEARTYEGIIKNNKSITKLTFNADFTTWSKPMYVDNIVTNILEN